MRPKRKSLRSMWPKIAAHRLVLDRKNDKRKVVCIKIYLISRIYVFLQSSSSSPFLLVSQHNVRPKIFTLDEVFMEPLLHIPRRHTHIGSRKGRSVSFKKNWQISIGEINNHSSIKCCLKLPLLSHSTPGLAIRFVAHFVAYLLSFNCLKRRQESRTEKEKK